MFQANAVKPGFFYLISPIARVWLHEWGFYAESVAAIFFPPTVLFFDLFLTRLLEGLKGGLTRFYFCLTALFLGLSFLAHPTIFFATLSFMGVYGFLLIWWPIKPIKKIKKRLGLILGSGIVFFIVSLGLVAFWFLPGLGRTIDSCLQG